MASLVWYHAQVKMEVAGYKSFNSAKLKYDETTVQTVDILFREDDMKYIGKTNKGRDVYRIGPFTSMFSYKHPVENWIEYNCANVILPFPGIPWDETFFFGHDGEIWYKGIPSESPNCEAVTFYVSPNWDYVGGEWIPTFVVADSHRHYLNCLEKMMKLESKTIEYSYVSTDDKGKEVKKTEKVSLSEFSEKDPILMDEIIEARMIGFQKSITELKIGKRRAEADRDALLSESFDIDKSVRERLKDIKRRHKDIMRVTEPLRIKLINMRTFGIILAVLITGTITYLALTGGF